MIRVRNHILSSAAAIASKLANNSSAQKILFNSIRLNRQQFYRLWQNDEIRFLNYAFAMRAQSRSQILQDLWVCFELNEKRCGFFVEFGATNGLTNSNTWLLEKVFGWSGILVEPNPFWHLELASNRRVPIEHRCVASNSGNLVSFLTTENSDPELSTIASYSKGDHFGDLRVQGNTIKVETISLNDLLSIHHAPERIDYLSMDTEGSELDILTAFDFSRYRPSLISVEQNSHTEGGIQDILETNGYVRVFRHYSQWDGWYVSEELRAKAKPKIFAPVA